MADCKIVNANVKTAVTNIKTIAGKYKTAGETFETNFKAALTDMEGDSKDALIDLFDKSYKTFVSDDKSGLPAMIEGVATLLEGNRSNFESVDSKIADSIRNGK